jgi:hypothetical protein
LSSTSSRSEVPPKLRSSGMVEERAERLRFWRLS